MISACHLHASNKLTNHQSNLENKFNASIFNNLIWKILFLFAPSHKPMGYLQNFSAILLKLTLKRFQGSHSSNLIGHLGSFSPLGTSLFHRPWILFTLVCIQTIFFSPPHFVLKIYFKFLLQIWLILLSFWKILSHFWYHRIEKNKMHRLCARTLSVNGYYPFTISSLKLTKKTNSDHQNPTIPLDWKKNFQAYTQP
jgi:hypothetical protein